MTVASADPPTIEAMMAFYLVRRELILFFFFKIWIFFGKAGG
jgi:hypothetical protein